MIAGLVGGSVRADVRLPAILTEHAVLQKSPATTVWGWSDPGEKITITLGNATTSAVGDAQGRWKTTLDLASTGPGPFVLKVQAKNQILESDVMVGDVWFSSGQSNMQFTLNATTDGAVEIAHSANSSLRWFMAKGQDGLVGPMEDVKGQWIVASPGSSGDCSGVAYYFGKKIQGDLRIPVGLVLTAVGGTTIQSWMSQEALAIPTVKDALEKAFPKKKRMQPQLVPSFFYNQLIRPLGNLSLRGVIWYQGEAHFNQGDFYRVAFPAMIEDWRALWHRPSLPFYYCQLPNIGDKTQDAGMEGWIAGLREGQDSGLAEPKTGEAILIDVGGVEFHPPAKKIVGERLALLAEAGTYGLPVQAQSPRFDSMSVQGDHLEVQFKDCPGGLVAGDLPKDVASPAPVHDVQGFAVCGTDGKWVWAQASIDGDKVEISSPAVQHPVAVRRLVKQPYLQPAGQERTTGGTVPGGCS